MNSVEVKKLAAEFGADLVGIVPVAGLPAERELRAVMPDARSVIVLGRKVLRGALRGVEEGTSFFSTYMLFGLDWHSAQFFPRVVFQLTRELERAGATAVPLSSRGGAGVKFDFRALATAAGLGSEGKGGFFLSPKYGHRQRLSIIVTDLELEGDTPAPVNFCENCNACVEACPLKAISVSSTGETTIDFEKCAGCKNGAMTRPGVGEEPVDRIAASCGRACLVAVEHKIGNRFGQKFRKRNVWTIGE